MSNKAVDLSTFLGDLDGGVFEQKLSRILSEAAQSTVSHSKGSKVIIEFDINRLTEKGNQVMIAHSLKVKMPTHKGSVSETETEKTPFFVNKSGTLTIGSEDQFDMFRERESR